MSTGRTVWPLQRRGTSVHSFSFDVCEFCCSLWNDGHTAVTNQRPGPKSIITAMCYLRTTSFGSFNIGMPSNSFNVLCNLVLSHSIGHKTLHLPSSLLLLLPPLSSDVFVYSFSILVYVQTSRLQCQHGTYPSAHKSPHRSIMLTSFKFGSICNCNPQLKFWTYELLQSSIFSQYNFFIFFLPKLNANSSWSLFFFNFKIEKKKRMKNTCDRAFNVRMTRIFNFSWFWQPRKIQSKIFATVHRTCTWSLHRPPCRISHSWVYLESSIRCCLADVTLFDFQENDLHLVSANYSRQHAAKIGAQGSIFQSSQNKDQQTHAQ